nr:hypothetical protein Iba_chr09cCG12900 [Ipomoea batatas]GME08535.1 hypothetical protein Iba_scaffold7752CG0010 [Ipomoea batatas]
MQSATSSFEVTFHKPSLARTMNSVSSSIFSIVTSGSTVMCSLSFASPNALVIANCPSTRGTFPGFLETNPPLPSTIFFSFLLSGS